MTTDRLAELTNDPELINDQVYTALTEETAALLCNRLDAAVALGVAIGLLLRPEAFGVNGGAR